MTDGILNKLQAAEAGSDIARSLDALQNICDLTDAYSAVDWKMPVTDYEARLLHDRGWSSGYGWETELDWWREEPHPNGSERRRPRFAYEHKLVEKSFLTDLQIVRREIAMTRLRNAQTQLDPHELASFIRSVRALLKATNTGGGGDA